MTKFTKKETPPSPKLITYKELLAIMKDDEARADLLDDEPPF